MAGSFVHPSVQSRPIAFLLLHRLFGSGAFIVPLTCAGAILDAAITFASSAGLFCIPMRH